LLNGWLTDEEKQAIIKFHYHHPLEAYRRHKKRHDNRPALRLPSMAAHTPIRSKPANTFGIIC
jgi:hypothetical protein